MLKAQLSNLGAYGGQANGDVIVDASTGNPAYALRGDLTGVRALPLLQSLADFDKLDGKLQAKISVRSSGTQPARDHVEPVAAPCSRCSRTAPSAASTSPR